MSRELLVPGTRPRRLWPRRLDLLFHVIKTVRLIVYLLRHKRVGIGRKVLFVGGCGVFLLLLLFPDAFGELVSSTLLPVVGTILGVPLDAGFDWLTLVLVLVSLLRVFPAEIVEEGYRRIFIQPKKAQP
ncbi:MAG: hypothetical protein IRZ31_01935 [Thermogemmatispora sp.]|uniref:hypothetical protein n=1 Tax=Thermogemmatispora sp. TaxID=1968838 RepID=UPI0026367D43|nr:hypothetical protein [Thermogemmatispora sp.]MBX5455634.1 hypothetical protein [Thermogemmatispora sp.]